MDRDGDLGALVSLESPDRLVQGQGRGLLALDRRDDVACVEPGPRRGRVLDGGCPRSAHVGGLGHWPSVDEIMRKLDGLDDYWRPAPQPGRLSQVTETD